MKTINVTFSDEEHELLLEAKANISWHDFIILLANQFSGHGVSVSIETIEKLTGKKFSSPDEAHRWLIELGKEGASD